ESRGAVGVSDRASGLPTTSESRRFPLTRGRGGRRIRIQEGGAKSRTTKSTPIWEIAANTLSGRPREVPDAETNLHLGHLGWSRQPFDADSSGAPYSGQVAR